MPTMRNEAHVCNYLNGHEMSVDCWCEPVTVGRVVDPFGVPVLVVVHEDYEVKVRHRIVVLSDREAAANPDDLPLDQPWITRALNGDMPLTGDR